MYSNRSLAGSMDSGLDFQHLEKRSMFKRYFSRIAKRNPTEDQAVKNEEAIKVSPCGITTADPNSTSENMACIVHRSSSSAKANLANKKTNDITSEYKNEHSANGYGTRKNENENNNGKGGRPLYGHENSSDNRTSTATEEKEKEKEKNIKTITKTVDTNIDHQKLFENILNKVDGTPAAENFLSILKMLLLIDGQSKENIQKWQQIDRFVNRTVPISQDEIKVALVKPVCADTEKDSITACDTLFRNIVAAKIGVSESVSNHSKSPLISHEEQTVKGETQIVSGNSVIESKNRAIAPNISKTETMNDQAEKKDSKQKKIGKNDSEAKIPIARLPVKETKCEDKLDELDKLELLLSSLSKEFPIPNPPTPQSSNGNCNKKLPSARPQTTGASNTPSSASKPKSEAYQSRKMSGPVSSKMSEQPKGSPAVHSPNTKSRHKQSALSSTANRNPQTQDLNNVLNVLAPISAHSRESSIKAPKGSVLSTTKSVSPVSAWASMSMDIEDPNNEGANSAYGDSNTPVVSPDANWLPKCEKDDDSLISDSDAIPPVRSRPRSKTLDSSSFKKSAYIAETKSHPPLQRMESIQLSDGNNSDSSGVFLPRRSEKPPTIFNWSPPNADDDTTEVESDSACPPPRRSLIRDRAPTQERSTPVLSPKPSSPKLIPAPAPPPPPPDFMVVPDIPGTPPPLQRSASLPQNAKMKTLQWNKIPNHLLSRSNSCIWKKLESIDIIDDNLDKLFAQPEAAKKKKAKKVVKPPEICLLEPKISMNVNIFLKQFKGGGKEVMKLMRAGKSNQLDGDRLRCLEKVLPDEKAVELLTSFSGNKEDLGEAERFFLQLITLPNYAFRLNTLILKEDFETSMEKLKPSIDTIKQAIEDLLDNDILPEVLSIILSVGNYMNHGSHAGNASAFKITSLLKLTDTRANSNTRITLLHYIVQMAEEKHLRLLEFPEMMPKLNDACLLSVDHLNDDVQKLKRRLEVTVKKFDKSTRDLKRQLGKFFNNALAEVAGLEWNIKEIRRLSNDLADYLCEDPKKFIVEDNLKVFQNFCKSLTKAKEENEEVKEMEARKALMGRRRWSQPILNTSDLSFGILTTG